MASALHSVEPRSIVPALAIPLTAPSAEAAMAFLSWAVPPSVFSSGSGRRRRRREARQADGRRSDQGYLVFYHAGGPDVPIRQTALKSPVSLAAYLETQAAAPPAEHWAAVQSTQYRARRDGRPVPVGYTAAQTRHLLAIVADLDGKRMAEPYRELLRSDVYAFRALVEDLLDDLGIDGYRLVRSGPEGLHVYVPLIRPDGRPLRATEATLAIWEKVARGLNRYLTPLGADENAVKVTQPFALPGLARSKHPGFVPYVTGGRDGARADLYALLRRLSALRLIPRREQVLPPSPTAPAASSDVSGLLSEIVEKAAGVSRGTRNRVAHDLAVYLLAKGAGEAQAWHALLQWNRRNDPPLPERELHACFRSALACEDRYPRQWREMQQAQWNRLRSMLELPAAPSSGYRQNGRWRPLTPPKPWEVRKATPGGREHYAEVAERLLRLVAGEGGSLNMTQAEIADRIDTNRSTLKAVIGFLEASERLQVVTRKGRGGTTLLTLPEPVVNGPSRISTGGVQLGVWVGSGGFVPEGTVCPADGTEASGSGWAVSGGRRDGTEVSLLRGGACALPVLRVIAGGLGGWSGAEGGFWARRLPARGGTCICVPIEEVESLRVRVKCACGQSWSEDVGLELLQVAAQVAPAPVSRDLVWAVGCGCGRDIKITAVADRESTGYAEVRVAIVGGDPVDS